MVFISSSLLAGDEHNRKSKREFRLFSLREKIDWFKTLREEQYPELVPKFGISIEDLNELKHLSKLLLGLKVYSIRVPK